MQIFRGLDDEVEVDQLGYDTDEDDVPALEAGDGE